jgi:hypothetical protein
MNYVILYRDPNVKIYNVLRNVYDCKNEKVEIPKLLLKELLSLWELACSKKFEYNVQKETYNYLLKGFKYINFIPEDKSLNLKVFIENFLNNATEDLFNDLYTKMFIGEGSPKDYSPFIIANAR